MWYSFADSSDGKMQNAQLGKRNFFASISTGEEKEFNFLRVLFGMLADQFQNQVLVTNMSKEKNPKLQNYADIHVLTKYCP